MFPLEELMLICKGCGGERLIPEHELQRIVSVDTFKVFMSGRVQLYRCPCGAPTCDVRMLPNAAAQAELRKGGGQ